MKGLLLLATMQAILRAAQSANGVIWDKKTLDFVPIFSIPEFAAIQQEIFDKSRAKETHNFQRRVVKFSYFEIHNLVNRNGNQVTGAIGEVWNTLSEYLNFTFRLYARSEIQHDPTWMVKMFSWKAWYAILATYCLLCLCSYLAQITESKITHRKLKTSLVDVFFYNFGAICEQNSLPSSSSKSLRIVEFCLGLFSCFLKIAFGALLIVYLTQTTNFLPFHSLKSLMDDSSYNILCLNSSVTSAAFKTIKNPTHRKLHEMNRVKFLDTEGEMYRMACTQGSHNALFLSTDIKKAARSYTCYLYPTEETLYDLYAVSGIARNFTYKRTIDIGLLKLYEVGIMTVLKRRWIERNDVNQFVTNETGPIIMEQVYLLLLIFAGGILISFSTLIFEILMFYYSN